MEMLNAILRMDLDANSIISFKANNISFHSDTPVSWTVDGEFAGKVYSADVNVEKRAIEIITDKKRELERANIIAQTAYAVPYWEPYIHM